MYRSNPIPSFFLNKTRLNIHFSDIYTNNHVFLHHIFETFDYILTFNNTLFLTDVNECTEKPDICGKEHQCVNMIGGYRCQCAPGYKNGENEKSCVGQFITFFKILVL